MFFDYFVYFFCLFWAPSVSIRVLFAPKGWVPVRLKNENGGPLLRGAGVVCSVSLRCSDLTVQLF